MTFLNDLLEETIEIIEIGTNQKISPNSKIEYPWDMFTFMEQIKASLEPGIYRGNNFEKGEYTVNEGIVICGNNVNLGNYSYTKGIVILGNNVNTSAEISNSIILNGTKAKHRTIYLGDSIIGKNSNISAGFITSNLRANRENINVRVKSNNDINQDIYSYKIYKTERRKLGLIAENNCFIMAQTKTNPGKYLNENSIYTGLCKK